MKILVATDRLLEGLPIRLFLGAQIATSILNTRETSPPGRRRAGRHQHIRVEIRDWAHTPSDRAGTCLCRDYLAQSLEGMEESYTVPGVEPLECCDAAL
jgi:hypothetical protein